MWKSSLLATEKSSNWTFQTEVMADLIRDSIPSDLYASSVWLAITSVWKVQFQRFKHFSVAYNELFHMVDLLKHDFLLKCGLFCVVPYNIQHTCTQYRNTHVHTHTHTHIPSGKLCRLLWEMSRAVSSDSPPISGGRLLIRFSLSISVVRFYKHRWALKY